MNCDSALHDEFRSMMELTCPFCDQQLMEANKVVELCCDEQELETVDGTNTCINCGLVHGCNYVAEYIDFYDNMHRIRQKSVYHCKYHIDYVLYSISSENNIQLNHNQRDRIHKVFVEIDSVLHEVNDDRKRMVI